MRPGGRQRRRSKSTTATQGFLGGRGVVRVALRRSMALTPQRGRPDLIRGLLVLLGQRVLYEKLRAERRAVGTRA